MTHTASFLKPRDRTRSRTKFKSFSENTDIRSRAPWEKKQCLNCKQMVILGLFSESIDLVHCMSDSFMNLVLKFSSLTLWSTSSARGEGNYHTKRKEKLTNFRVSLHINNVVKTEKFFQHCQNIHVQTLVWLNAFVNSH